MANKCGQVWDTSNVFVVGSSQFPQNAGMNLTRTVSALAYLVSDGLANRYVKDSIRFA